MNKTFVLHCINFLATGHWMSVGIQYLVLEGAADPTIVLFSYVCLLPTMYFMDKEPLTVHWKKIAGIGLLDVLANFLFSVSLIKAGSAYHTVVYSSLTIFVALLRRLLGRYISTIQWTAILFVVVGLVLTVYNVEDDVDSIHAIDARHHAQKATLKRPTRPQADRELGLGICLSMTCVLVMSCVYVSEEYIQSRQPPPSDEGMIWILGSVQLVIATLQLGFYSIPNWDTLITQPMKTAAIHTSMGMVVTMYVTVSVACLAHMISFFAILRSSKSGGVVLAILQGVRVIFVIGFGSIFLCSEQKSQCMTREKFLAILFVLFGATTFSLSAQVSEWLKKRGAPGWITAAEVGAKMDTDDAAEGEDESLLTDVANAS